jgi:hypothetical protein
MVPRQALESRSRRRSGGQLRPIVIAPFCGSVAVIALGVSRMGDGVLAAGAFMLALFLGTVTVGVVAAFFLDTAASLRVWLRRASGTVVCGTCRQPMQNLHSIWICPDCDGLPLDS